jgi:hypothetical protein
MPLPDNFVASLAFIHPRDIAALWKEGAYPKDGDIIALRNEVRPVDLYCYLGARFGHPNGIQNFLRKDDSDNLIHWEWTLRHAEGIVSFQGQNFRTEVLLHGPVTITEADKDLIVCQLKADFSAYGKRMGAVRHALEDWTELVNPYQRLRRSVNGLLQELDELYLDPDKDRIDDHWTTADSESENQRWQDLCLRYTRAFRLAFALRSMLPVMAESYVNLIMFILLRPEIKSDPRLRENAIRQPIDVRIKLLFLYCVGFVKQPDFSAEPCRQYHSLVNERNDLLHGNIVVDKLKFNDVYFMGRVPVFREYRSMWQRSLDIQMQAVGLVNVRNELAVVDNLIRYIESCMQPTIRDQVRQVADAYEIGWNKQTSRPGVLFPPHLVDMLIEPRSQSDIGLSGFNSPTT